jgi:hypothetical protein
MLLGAIHNHYLRIGGWSLAGYPETMTTLPVGNLSPLLNPQGTARIPWHSIIRLDRHGTNIISPEVPDHLSFG